MSSDEERTALTNLANFEALMFLTYWARQQGVIVSYRAVTPAERTYQPAPPQIPEPSPPSIDLRCEENLEAIELSFQIEELNMDLGILELTNDEWEQYLAEFP